VSVYRSGLRSGWKWRVYRCVRGLLEARSRSGLALAVRPAAPQRALGTTRGDRGKEKEEGTVVVQ
jgi:hypothetical protein